MNKRLRIVHVEDNSNDAELVRNFLLGHRIDADIEQVPDRPTFVAALSRGRPDLVLSDSNLPGLSGLTVLQLANSSGSVPVIVVSGMCTPERWEVLRVAGAAACVSKAQLWQLPATIEEVLTPSEQRTRSAPLAYAHSAEHLVAVVQELSLAHDLGTVMAIVRHAARELTGADGATFVLRDGDLCYYADEDAIAPLWKGNRFPMTACISGWAMLNRQSAVIEDIYADPRVPADAYRPTFVKSLAMVPIRTAAPIGAIGNYWAKPHRTTPTELRLLQALADSTSIALENVKLYDELEQRVRDRTAELETANRELESFSYAVSHDLRAPLRSIEGFSVMLREDCVAQLDNQGIEYLDRIHHSVRHMGQLIDDLLGLARTTRASLALRDVDLSALALEIVMELRANEPGREVNVVIASGVQARVDPGLMRVVLTNLLNNAWKFTARREQARIEFGTRPSAAGDIEYFIKDNGAGFESEFVHKLFTPFQRLHHEADFPGHGIGLATVQRIVRKHGGNIRAEGSLDAGATFYFTLG